MSRKSQTDLNTSRDDKAQNQTAARQTVVGAESEHHKFASNLLRDVRILTMYAVQQGRLPVDVHIEKVCRISDDFESNRRMQHKDVSLLSSYYEKLESEFPAVNARTLRATECWEGNSMSSDAGRYLKGLWCGVVVIFSLIIVTNLTQYVASTNGVDGAAAGGFDWLGIFHHIVQHLEPFTYGALGSCAYLLRVTEQRLRSREFDPIRTPEHWNRLVLGTISGGVIVLLVQELSNNGGTPIQIAGAALGFIAGYSVDFLFETIDRVISSILPKVSYESMRKRDAHKRRLEEANQFRKAAVGIPDDHAKKLLEQVIGALERG